MSNHRFISRKVLLKSNLVQKKQLHLDIHPIHPGLIQKESFYSSFNTLMPLSPLSCIPLCLLHVLIAEMSTHQSFLVSIYLCGAFLLSLPSVDWHLQGFDLLGAALAYLSPALFQEDFLSSHQPPAGLLHGRKTDEVICRQHHVTLTLSHTNRTDLSSVALRPSAVRHNAQTLNVLLK